ncbi:MAG: tRNA pseudouridine(55) synthase TruB [Gemmatimonadota bacterium]|nr:tRNA pseudouridine(55) synthase TruB [Gemmatimonadota bacterium]
MDKPAGITSHDVVQRVRRALGIRAVGHTGTLDPFATGLLILLVGPATRLARFVEAQAKTYLATARLGVRTDTDDLTGTALDQPAASGEVGEARVREALGRFLGEQQQRPPGYSAKHIDGERSYRRARRGEQVELPAVPVTVHRIDLLSYRASDITFRATVSAGTYLRAIARDLGERLEVGAHLTALRREAIGAIRVEDAVSLDCLSAADLLPASRVLEHLPALQLDEADRRAVAHGRAVVGSAPSQPRGDGMVALLADGDVVAIAQEADGLLQPRVVLRAP